MSWRVAGRGPGMITSPSNTANGSSPTNSLRRQHGMAQSQWLLLPRIAEMHQVADGADHFGQFRLAMHLQKPLQFRRRIEMVLDGVLAAARDNDDVFDARGDALLDDVLNQRLVDDRKHLLGLRLGRRQESRAQARRGQHGFAHSFGRFWHGRQFVENLPIWSERVKQSGARNRRYVAMTASVNPGKPLRFQSCALARGGGTACARATMNFRKARLP